MLGYWIFCTKSIKLLSVVAFTIYRYWYGFIYFGSVGNSFQSPSVIFGGCSRFFGSWNKTRHSGTRHGTKSGLSIRIPPKIEGAPWKPDFHNPSCFKGSPLNQTQQRSFAQVVDFGAAIWKFLCLVWIYPSYPKNYFNRTSIWVVIIAFLPIEWDIELTCWR